MPLPSINIPNFNGISTPVYTPNSGRQAAVDSAAIALSTEDKADLAIIAAAAADTINPSPVRAIGNDEYEAVAASATDQIMGVTGAVGDRLSHILIQPATTSPGQVVVKDNATVIWTFPGGANSVPDLKPFPVPFGVKALNAGFKITTGANVSVLAVGDFT